MSVKSVLPTAVLAAMLPPSAHLAQWGSHSPTTPASTQQLPILHAEFTALLALSAVAVPAALSVLRDQSSIITASVSLARLAAKSAVTATSPYALLAL
jgi:hypothetical protein